MKGATCLMAGMADIAQPVQRRAVPLRAIRAAMDNKVFPCDDRI